MEKSEIKSFQENGFLIVDSLIDSAILDKAKDGYNQIYTKVKNGQYPYIRVYDDYSNKPNLAGIEMVFNPEIIDKNIINLLNHTKILDYAKEILGDDIKLTLSRYHITENISHIGIWHRDAPVNHKLNSLQINLYLFDEQGIQILPKSHLKELEHCEIKKTPYAALKNTQSVKTKKGQLLIFNPAILHRGISPHKRANLHFRFEKKDSEKKDYCTLSYDQKYSFFKNINFSEEWKKVIFSDDSIIFPKDIKKYTHPKNFKNKVLRIIRMLIHNTIFFLPIDFWLYRKLNVRPNLKLRKIFKISS